MSGPTDGDELVRRAERRSAQDGPLRAVTEMLERAIGFIEAVIVVLRAAAGQLDSTDRDLISMEGERWWDSAFEARRLAEEGDDV